MSQRLRRAIYAGLIAACVLEFLYIGNVELLTGGG